MRSLTTALAHPATLAGFWNANSFFPEPQSLAFSEPYHRSIAARPAGLLALGESDSWLQRRIPFDVGAVRSRHVPFRAIARRARLDRSVRHACGHDRRRRSRGRDRVQSGAPGKQREPAGRAIDSLAAVRAAWRASLSPDRLATCVAVRSGRRHRAEPVVHRSHGLQLGGHLAVRPRRNHSPEAMAGARVARAVGSHGRRTLAYDDLHGALPRGAAPHRAARRDPQVSTC